MWYEIVGDYKTCLYLKPLLHQDTQLEQEFPCLLQLSMKSSSSSSSS
jgi:hypothetical protein